MGDPRRTAIAVLIVAGGAAAVIAFAAVLFWLLPEIVPIEVNDQILARTSPGTLDLAAAIATGFAGAFGLARRDVSDVLPGVAIRDLARAAALGRRDHARGGRSQPRGWSFSSCSRRTSSRWSSPAL